MIKSAFSKANAAQWAFGLELSLVALAINELTAWFEWRAPVAHVAPLDGGPVIILIIALALLWALSLTFAEKPRQWMLENIEIPLGAAMSLLVLPFVLTMLLDILFGISPVMWMGLWASAIVGGAFALSLTASLIWGVMEMKTAGIAAACLICTTAANEFIDATSSLGLALALASATALTLAIGHFSESEQPVQFTLWRAPLGSRLELSSSGIAWAFLLVTATLLALEFDFVMMLVTPAALACALYLYDDDSENKLIVLGLAMMAFSILIGIEAISLDAYLITGLGLALMLVCTECGPALASCAAGCLLAGMATPYVFEIELDRSLYDPALITLSLAALACLIALCCSRPKSMLLTTFETKIFDFLFLDEDFDWDDFEDDFELEGLEDDFDLRDFEDDPDHDSFSYINLSAFYNLKDLDSDGEGKRPGGEDEKLIAELPERDPNTDHASGPAPDLPAPNLAPNESDVK